jgi:hypothetical protein
MRSVASARGQSLGELIAALRPGDSCPWCGARLQRGTALKQVCGTSAGTQAAPSDEEIPEVMLSCPECGSEVCGTGANIRTRGRGSLGAAA